VEKINKIGRGKSKGRVGSLPTRAAGGGPYHEEKGSQKVFQKGAECRGGENLKRARGNRGVRKAALPNKGSGDGKRVSLR